MLVTCSVMGQAAAPGPLEQRRSLLTVLADKCRGSQLLTRSPQLCDPSAAHTRASCSPVRWSRGRPQGKAMNSSIPFTFCSLAGVKALQLQGEGAGWPDRALPQAGQGVQPGAWARVHSLCSKHPKT